MTALRPPDGLDSKEAIRAALDALHAESVAYWTAFSTRMFLAPLGDAWSPGDNIRHLTKSMRAVTRGLRLPKFVVRLSFGVASGESRSYDEVRELYRRALTPGVSAGGFAPEPRGEPGEPEAERTRIMGHHAAAVGELGASLDQWTERQLDRCRLPHPLLGPLTVREMLLFTLYHNRHHLDGVKRRVTERGAGTS